MFMCFSTLGKSGFALQCAINPKWIFFFFFQRVPLHCKCQLPWWWFSVAVTSRTPLLWKSHQTPCVRKQLAVPYHCSPQTHHTELNTIQFVQIQLSL